MVTNTIFLKIAMRFGLGDWKVNLPAFVNQFDLAWIYPPGPCASSGLVGISRSSVHPGSFCSRAPHVAVVAAVLSCFGRRKPDASAMTIRQPSQTEIMRKTTPILFVLSAAAGGILMTGCVAPHKTANNVPGTVLYPTGRRVVDEAPPALRKENPGATPSGNEVWIPGYWTHPNQRWVWLPGHWGTPPTARGKWIPGHWNKTDTGNQWEWTSGHWTD